MERQIDKVDKEIEKAIKKKTDIPKNRFNSDNTLDIKCKLCEESFDTFVDLENHIEVCHEKHNVFQCDKCEKGFVLKWRLKKHMRLHAETNIKPCHYFNNDRNCPFKNLDASFAIRLLKFVSSGKNAQEDFALTDMERSKEQEMTPMIQLKTVKWMTMTTLLTILIHL